MEITNYSVKKEIVKYPDLCAAVAVVLDKTSFATIATANDGIVPAGTLINFDLKNRATKAVPADDTTLPTGVLRYDVKLTGKDADHAAAIIHGYVDLDQIPTAPTTAQEEAMPHVVFMR